MPPFRPGPKRRRGSALYGGAPLPLPQVSAVGVNNLTATSANVVGSINPQGFSASWWIVYGTTPQFGAQTTPQALTATNLPQTVSVVLTALTAAATYYFAVVAQTSGGTVTSAPLSFVAAIPQPISDITNPPAPVGTPLVGTPHYKFPITFSALNGVGVVEQDTLDEVFSNVQAVAACQVGACPELPTFGVPELTFGQAPLNPAAVVSAIQRWEPRAAETSLSEPVGDPDSGVWRIALTTGFAEGGS